MFDSLGLARATLIRDFPFQSGGDHSLLFASGGQYSDPGFAVRVLQGPLRSPAWTGGPARTTAISNWR